jgi:N utilization substance protein A
VKTELLLALEQLEKEKGLSIDMLFDVIEDAMVKAYKNNFGATHNVEVELNRETGDITVYSIRLIVDEVIDDATQVSLEEAKAINPEYESGDVLKEKVTPKDFGRIAAQSAKQVVVQKIREAERGVIYDEFSSRESEIVNGVIHRVSKGIVYITLGRTEALMAANEQIPHEEYIQGARIKTVITEVKNSTKGPQIFVSRTHPGLVKRLFELEVPEIYDGEVEIKSISREPGSRTKIAVYSSNPDLDPVGACVGPKGHRVQNIVEELQGEKIDIIEWNENPAILISNALNPSKVMRVEVDEDDNSALVVVPDYQLSLAIGKEGQNARLAAKLTGWKIDIKSETQYIAYLKDIGEYEEVYGDDAQ